MTIQLVHGNIFDADVAVLVNPVNTVGVMGKGLALQFKQRNETMFKRYAKRCLDGSLHIGTLQLVRLNQTQFVLNFPTKRHWRHPSCLADIEVGLQKFVASYKAKHITSIAFPPLGAGLGGLDFDTQVLPLMQQYLADCPDLTVLIYVP